MTANVERSPLVIVITAAAILAAACDGSTPTGPSETVFPSSADPKNLALASPAEYAADHEDFDCRAVETVRVRFGAPGYVDHDRVGLYVFYSGLAEGPKRLRIWWNYENDPTRFRDFVFADDVRDIEEIYEYHYPDVVRPTEMLVRVELIRDGLTGNCPRNRWVTLSPRGGGGAAPGPTAPATQTASVGPPITAVDFSDWTFDGVAFTVLAPLTIDSLWIDVQQGGTLAIELYDGAGVGPLASATAPVAAGPQQVSLGFTLAPGDYVLAADASAVGGLGVTFEGTTSYPYEIPGVIRLTNTAFGFAPWYYFFYDWQVTW